MSVEVRVTSTLRTVVGAKSVNGDGSTVGALLADLEARYPGFKAQISGDDGELHRFVNVYVNDEDIRYLQALDTPVGDKDVVSILPALAGGSLPTITGDSLSAHPNASLSAINERSR